MYGRSMMSLVAAHSLGKKGIDVIGCDEVDLTVMSFSRYVTKTFVHPPIESNTKAFIDFMLKQIQKFAPDNDIPYVLMPIFRETELISEYRSVFEPYIKVAAPDYLTLQQVHPKDNLFHTAELLGLHIPPTIQPNNEAELQQILRHIEFPALVKPVNQVGGRGIIKTQNPQELISAYKKSVNRYKSAPLIQGYIDGDDYCLTVLYDNGVRKASMAYRNIHRFPAESGAGSMRETVADAPFLATADTLLHNLKWHGIVQLDFRWDKKQPPCLIEVNPRFWAGLFQSVASGIDFPFALFQMTANGKAPQPNQAAIGKKTKIPGLWLLGAIHSIANSEEDYIRLRDEWSNVQNKIRHKEIRDAFKLLQESIDQRFNIKKTITELRKIVAEGRTAQNDIFFRDDPFVVLGVLFILTSLIRHRKIPPEVLHR